MNSLLAGIVVNTALYSINIAVMGNTSLLNMNKTETVFTKMQSALEGTFLAGQQKLAVSLIAVCAGDRVPVAVPADKARPRHPRDRQ